MLRVKTESIIYKLISYSDRSAIGYVLSKDFGIIKVFISSAYNKKGGVFKFIPGLMDIRYKENGALHKFYNFEHYVSYSYFIDNPYVFARLNVIFFLLQEYHIDDYSYLWKLLLNINEQNIYKSFIYITHYLLNSSGYFPEMKCVMCEKTDNLYIGNDLNIKCVDCKTENFLKIGEDLIKLFEDIHNKEVFKKVFIGRELEKKYVSFLKYFVENNLNRKIKVFEFFDMI
ncbi:hypothetical protein OWM07_01865 [Deferribacter thermophilus]|uniref:hypothetical protein n=1 Tax=Deferribacter thermophilus TaxID=53573 RepID=UPI003C18B8CA